MAPFRCVAIALILGITAWSEVWSAGYAFTNIVDNTMQAPFGLFQFFGFSTDGGGFYNIPVAVSGDKVAFQASYSGGEGVFVGNGGPLTVISKRGDAGPRGSFARFSNIGISGDEVSFLGNLSLPGPDEDGVFVGDGGEVETVGTLGQAVYPAIDDGAVAYVGMHLGANGVLVESQGSTTPIVLQGAAGPIGEFASFRDPAIDNGVVAFTGSYTGGHGIFSSDGETLTTIAKTGDISSAGVLSGLGGASISEGKVAFLGRYFGGAPSHQGIFVGDGGPLATIAKGGDLTDYGALIDFDAPSISHDLVAFHATWNDGHGIFVWKEGVIKAALQTGDALFGSTVVNFGFRRFGLDPNGSGNLAFAYVLADGRLGVALARQVPEPSTLALAFLALVAEIRCRRQRNC
jgi:hypothetical protein